MPLQQTDSVCSCMLFLLTCLDQDNGYDQSLGSGFSVNRMGSEFDRPSFLADLGQNMTVTRAGWYKLANWDTQAGFGTFKSSYAFNEATGRCAVVCVFARE